MQFKKSSKKSLSNVFNKSSIHGLPYLTPKHHGPFGRLVWLLCVLFSFSLAGLVIWKNVHSWQSQPTVVSSVEYALIQVIELQMISQKKVFSTALLELQLIAGSALVTTGDGVPNIIELNGNVEWLVAGHP